MHINTEICIQTRLYSFSNTHNIFNMLPNCPVGIWTLYFWKVLGRGGGGRGGGRQGGEGAGNGKIVIFSCIVILAKGLKDEWFSNYGCINTFQWRGRMLLVEKCIPRCLNRHLTAESLKKGEFSVLMLHSPWVHISACSAGSLHLPGDRLVEVYRAALIDWPR